MKNIWSSIGGNMSGPFRADFSFARYPWVYTHGYSRASASRIRWPQMLANELVHDGVSSVRVLSSPKVNNVNIRGCKPAEKQQNIPGPEGAEQTSFVAAF